MFEAERERCYAGIRKCDAFLQNEIVRGTRASEMMPEQVIKLFEEYGEQRRVAIFHLKAKMHFIRLLVDFQEAENALHVD